MRTSKSKAKPDAVRHAYSSIFRTQCQLGYKLIVQLSSPTTQLHATLHHWQQN